jgi:uncharacterized repeat protein (TIGR03847 family)
LTIYEYVEPERFVAGTVGRPGQRTFYLQAHDGARTTSVSLEKGQVAILAERLDDLLDALLRQSGGTLSIPAVVMADQQDHDPLESPVEDEFRAVGLSLMWDDEIDRVVVEAHSTDDSAEEADSESQEATAPPETLRVVMTGVAARAFVARALSVVSAGRPPCPFCSLPLDPEGHICPRQNGHRRHLMTDQQ